MKSDYHGSEHQPGGPDPSVTGPWHYPELLNGWENVGGDDSVPMRYRLIIGPFNKRDNVGTLVMEERKSIEIQGDITGGTDGTVVFTLPEEHRLDYSVPFSAHDDTGAYVACRLYKNGDFVRGTP